MELLLKLIMLVFMIIAVGRKSNSVFKFELLQTVLGFYVTKNKLFLLPGHSHNSSDVKTAEINRCVRKKNIYTSQQMCRELSEVKKAEIHVLDPLHFYEWEPLLNKFFKDLPVGFTSYYCYELSEGVVKMKRLSEDTPDSIFEQKTLVENVEATRIAILDELFGLPPDASLADIVKSKPKLANIKIKTLPEKRLESIKKKYPVIPVEHLRYYPGGSDFVAGGNVEEEEDAAKEVLTLVKPKKKAGRPKAVQKTNQTQAF